MCECGVCVCVGVYIHCLCDATGDARNDIYVTLDGGSFSKGTKTAERNVEVVVNVVDKSGTVIPVSPSHTHTLTHSHTHSLTHSLTQRAIMVGAGAQPSHEYISFIYYHNNNPKWKETFKVCFLVSMVIIINPAHSPVGNTI